MQPSVRTLDQIISEIRGVYDPQINTLRQKQSSIPDMIKNEETALGAKQEQAFGDILSGARRRGLGFSGIPVGEQAKYSATEYMPALARLRQSGQDQAMSLEEAILGINERLQNQALGMRQYDQERYDTWKAQQEALAESRRQAAASNSWMSALGGGGGTAGASDPNAQIKSIASQEVDGMLGRKGTKSFYEEIQAIAKSAGYGNQKDQAKLELLQAVQPGLFSNGALNTNRIASIMAQLGSGPATTAPAPSTGQLYKKAYGGVLPWMGNRLKENAGIFR